MASAKRERLKNIWYGMRQRCYGPDSPCSKYYKDKGIRICYEWLESFEVFKTWALSHGYADNLTIDRIDSDGNYEPENCRWITAAENSRRAKLGWRKNKQLCRAPRITGTIYGVEAGQKAVRTLEALIPMMSPETRAYLLGYGEGLADAYKRRDEFAKNEVRSDQSGDQAEAVCG